MSESGIVIGIAVIAVWLISIVFYFLPSLIAVIRKVPNTGSTIVVNLFLGWTLIGWVAALAMAVRSRPQPAVPATPAWGTGGQVPGPAPGLPALEPYRGSAAPRPGRGTSSGDHDEPPDR